MSWPRMGSTTSARSTLLSPISWSQRLGYILELVGREDMARVFEPFVQRQARSYTLLRCAAAIAKAMRGAKWKFIVNVQMEADG